MTNREENPLIQIAVEYAAKYNGTSIQEEMEKCLNEENNRCQGLLYSGAGGGNHQSAKTS